MQISRVYMFILKAVAVYILKMTKVVDAYILKMMEAVDAYK